MNKKVLMLAAKAKMIQQFNHRNIKILKKFGYEVHVVTNISLLCLMTDCAPYKDKHRI